MNLKTIDSAPKDGRYILLFGPSGYTTTPLRCEVGHWDPEYRPRNPWQTHSNDAFTDGGEPPTHWCEIPTEGATADEMIQKLEEQGLGWDIGNTGRLIEVRIWAWPYVLARYRPATIEPLAQMLWKAVLLMPTGPGAIKADVTPSSTTPPNPYP